MTILASSEVSPLQVVATRVTQENDFSVTELVARVVLVSVPSADAGTTASLVVEAGAFSDVRIGDVVVNTTRNRESVVVEVVDVNTVGISPEITGQTSGDTINVVSWLRADNRDHKKIAVGVVVAASQSEFRIVTSHGEVVKLPEHGFGFAPDELWLGIDGGVTTAAPTAQVVQKVFMVLDSNHILLFPPSPWTVA